LTARHIKLTPVTIFTLATRREHNSSSLLVGCGFFAVP
jgi:hypothetical protein